MIEHTFTVFCPFGGGGFGAHGFAAAEIAMLGRRAKFKVISGDGQREKQRLEQLGVVPAVLPAHRRVLAHEGGETTAREDYDSRGRAKRSA